MQCNSDLEHDSAGVRARQEKVAFAMCDDPAEVAKDVHPLLGMLLQFLAVEMTAPASALYMACPCSPHVEHASTASALFRLDIGTPSTAATASRSPCAESYQAPETLLSPSIAAFTCSPMAASPSSACVQRCSQAHTHAHAAPDCPIPDLPQGGRSTHTHGVCRQARAAERGQ